MDDILTNISDLFLGNGIIIIIGCFVIGMILKGTVKSIPNKFIPYINIVISIVLGFVIPGTFEDEGIVAKVILLAFIGLSSVGLYELICIIIKDRFSLDLKKLYNNILKSSDIIDESSGQTYEDVPPSRDNDNRDYEEENDNV